MLFLKSRKNLISSWSLMLGFCLTIYQQEYKFHFVQGRNGRYKIYVNEKQTTTFIVNLENFRKRKILEAFYLLNKYLFLKKNDLLNYNQFKH